MSRASPYGYRFVAVEEHWESMEEKFHPGSIENWDRIPSDRVELGRPVLILLSSSQRRIAGIATVVGPPDDAPPEMRNQAWVRYDEVFDNDAFPLPPAADAAQPRAQWDDRTLPLILGLESSNPGRVRPAPFGIPHKTLGKISTADARRIRALFPKLPFGPDV